PNIFTYLFDYTNLRKIVPNDYFHKKHYYLDESPPTSKKIVGAVSGSFMLIERKVINQIGSFDERYFMYLEDVDYCLRAGKAGFKVLLCPKSIIKHVGGYSSKNKEKVNVGAWLESRRRYVFKNENLLINLIIQPIFLIDTVIIRILQQIKKNEKLFKLSSRAEPR
ncbi:glycosyltransferase, partial [Patescibacteria group bacterium]|nr:glycosyltransferase [Patescibacteria group bacterium]MBU1457466.1 glycosyltransferase [Patescibacteria group bacterium]